jgi:hypothetical protein
VNTAFEKAGLNFEDIGDWIYLTVYLASAVYGKRPDRTWSPEEYERLLNDIANIKAAHPNDGELECCKRLLKKQKYNRINKAATLRRQLQNAKLSKQLKERLIALADKGKDPLDIMKAEKELRNRQSD